MCCVDLLNFGDECERVSVSVYSKILSGAKAYEKAEDPLWALENNIPLDAQYYLQNQLTNPLMRIFKVFLFTIFTHKC